MYFVIKKNLDLNHFKLDEDTKKIKPNESFFTGIKDVILVKNGVTNQNKLEFILKSGSTIEVHITGLDKYTKSIELHDNNLKFIKSDNSIVEVTLFEVINNLQIESSDIITVDRSNGIKLNVNTNNNITNDNGLFVDSFTSFTIKDVFDQTVTTQYQEFKTSENVLPLVKVLFSLELNIEDIPEDTSSSYLGTGIYYPENNENFIALHNLTVEAKRYKNLSVFYAQENGFSRQKDKSLLGTNNHESTLVADLIEDVENINTEQKWYDGCYYLTPIKEEPVKKVNYTFTDPVVIDYYNKRKLIPIFQEIIKFIPKDSRGGDVVVMKCKATSYARVNQANLPIPHELRDMNGLNTIKFKMVNGKWKTDNTFTHNDLYGSQQADTHLEDILNYKLDQMTLPPDLYSSLRIIGVHCNEEGFATFYTGRKENSIDDPSNYYVTSHIKDFSSIFLDSFLYRKDSQEIQDNDMGVISLYQLKFIEDIEE